MGKKGHKRSIQQITWQTEQLHAAIFIQKTEALTKLIIPLTRLLVVGAITFYLLYSINSYLTHEAEKLDAIARILEMLKFDRIMPWLAASAATVGWIKERKAKQRAISKKAEFQGIAEQNDSYRSSSGLTTIGTTPKAG